MFHITPKSKNAKVGKMAVTTSTATTCPSACPFRDNGCYAESGPLKLHWLKVTEGKRGDDWSTFIDKIVTGKHFYSSFSHFKYSSASALASKS